MYKKNNKLSTMQNCQRCMINLSQNPQNKTTMRQQQNFKLKRRFSMN